MQYYIFNISFKTPLFNPVYQGLHRFGSRDNSTFPSWPFSFSSPSSFSSALNDTSACNDSSIVRDSQHPLGLTETLEANGVGSDHSSGFVNPREKDEVFENGHVGPESRNFKSGQEIGRNSISSYLLDDSSENVKNESINVEENTLVVKIEGER